MKDTARQEDTLRQMESQPEKAGKKPYHQPQIKKHGEVREQALSTVTGPEDDSPYPAGPSF